MLNVLFDAEAKAIAGHGGEILKFIGDGLLAIFPIEYPSVAGVAARNALAAATQAVEAARGLTSDPSLVGEPPLEIVVALHIGTVIYGNIGAANRLDFTVIGPAVNLVSRIEAVAKTLNVPIVVSADFAHHFEPSLEAKAITSKPRRDENAGDASGEQRVNRFTRHCPRLFRCGGAIPDARCQSADPGKDLIMRLDRVTPTLARHYPPHLFPRWQLFILRAQYFERR